MNIGPGSKVFLKGIHQEIDLFDRKIAYANNLEQFESEGDKKKALTRLSTKRDKLVKTARELAAQGVEVDQKDLARSFRAEAGLEPLTKTATKPEPPAQPKTAFGANVTSAEAEQRQNSRG